MREKGYYRVKIFNEWTVAQYLGGYCWFLVGNEVEHFEEDLQEIDERKIKFKP